MSPRQLLHLLAPGVALLAMLSMAVPSAHSEQAPASIQSHPESMSLETPAGWDLMPGHSEKIAITVSQTAYFGDEPIASGALAYRRSDHGAIYLTWVDSIRAHPSPEAALRTAFDDLHEAPFLATSEAESTQEILYRERNFDGVAELRFEWAHLKNETVNLVRALGWKDSDGRVHLAIAECVLHSENAPEIRPTCQASLDSLHLTSAANHEALRSLAPPKRVGSGLRAEDIQVPRLTTGSVEPGATLGAPPREIGEVLYNGRPPPAKNDKSNRFLIAIGLLLLVAAFFLTTRSKEKDSSATDDDDDDDDDDDKDANQEEEKAE